jgi:hypothetical protein
MSRLPWLVSVVLALALGATGMLLLRRPMAKVPDGPVVLEKIREVARLETLDVTLYRKVSFTPDPPGPGDSAWESVLNWAKFNLRNAHGRAILFADAHLGLDLSQLGPQSMQVRGEQVALVLPPIQVQVELRPGETEIMDSNLDSAQTAQLMDEAKRAFQLEVQRDGHLQGRARASAERSLRGLLLSLGFREVVFVEELPTMPPS